MFAGLGLIGLAFIMSWWSLTKYRVSFERGVNMKVDGQALLDKLGDDREKYNREVAEYRTDWENNTRQYNEFYVDHIASTYQTDLDILINRSLSTGTVFFRGWSTWTGWFGILAILTVIGLYVAPKFKPEPMEKWAWTAPWAAAALGALYLVFALMFYFDVPDENGSGYSQGVAIGGYVAILAGLVTAVGGVFEGLKSAERRLESIESEPDDDVEESPPISRAPPKRPAAAPPSPPSPPTNRLTEW